MLAHGSAFPVAKLALNNSVPPILMASLRDHVSNISDEESGIIFKENFAKSQKAWEEFVVSDCKFRASKYHGGSLAGVEHAFCHVNANKLRAKELLTVLKNP